MGKWLPLSFLLVAMYRLDKENGCEAIYRQNNDSERVFVSACLGERTYRAERSEAAIESIYTGLNTGSCKEYIDYDDPNDTPYQLCPGVSGYSLIVRHVGSRRQSIDVVTPAKRVFSLDYHEVITRYMFQIDDRAEWRVSTKNGKKMPIALIVRVLAHENQDEPGQVTHVYLALAKIQSDESCVTDRILEGSLSREKVRSVADSAQARKCLQPRPQKFVRNTGIRQPGVES